MNQYLKILALGILLSLSWAAGASAQQTNVYCTQSTVPPFVWVPCGVVNPLATIGGELVGDATGTFTNATQTNAVTQTGLDGYGTALVSVNGTYNTGTGVFELSDDGGTTWYPVQASRINSCTVETGYTGLTNINQVWTVPISGADQFRVRSTAVGSGTVNVRISISSAVPPSSTSVCGNVLPGYPSGTTALSGNGSGTTGAVVGTLTATSTTTAFLCGFSVSAVGTGAVGPITIAGLTGSSQVWQLTAIATGGTVSSTFSPCIPASAVNTNITTTTTADATASTVNVNSWGYRQ